KPEEDRVQSICNLLGRVPGAIVLTARALKQTKAPLAQVQEILSRFVPQSSDESAAGLERANTLVRTLGITPVASGQEEEPLRQRLAAAAREWERLGRDASVLWGKVLLDELPFYD